MKRGKANKPKPDHILISLLHMGYLSILMVIFQVNLG